MAITESTHSDILNICRNVLHDSFDLVLFHVCRADQRFCLFVDNPTLVDDKARVSLLNCCAGRITIANDIIDDNIRDIFADDNMIHVVSGVLVLRISAHIKLMIQKVDKPIICDYF